MEKTNKSTQITKLSARKVQWGVKGKKIIKNISIAITNQELIGLIGPNGSGKSSLLRLLYKYYTPKQGGVYIKGRDILSMSQKEVAQNIGVVLQEKEGLNDRTVYDIVLMGRSPHKGIFEKDTKEDQEIVLDALNRVHLTNKENRHFSTLSGGEKQRVLIAMAIAQETEMLILDEPTNHLDPRYQLEIMNLIKSLNIPTIVAIHDLNLASMFCDRLILLKDGHIFTEGTPQKVLTKKNIKDVYDVDVEIQKTKNNRISVVYLNSHNLPPML